MHDSPVSTSTDTLPKIIYILYLVAVVIGITSIIGVILAYIYRDDAPDWLKSHYRFQIRTFWIGLLYALVGSLILSSLQLNLLVFLALLIWLVARCAKGLKYLSQRQAHPDPLSWLF